MIDYAYLLMFQAKFVIPNGEMFDRTILMKVGKQWKHYKYTLKMMKFDPHRRTKEQIVNDVPHGHTRDNWMRLVEHWYSESSKVILTFKAFKIIFYKSMLVTFRILIYQEYLTTFAENVPQW